MTRWAILTGEYPPQAGGVSDYTRLIATKLAEAGDVVRVYAPSGDGLAEIVDGAVSVFRLPDHFGLRGLAVLDRELSRRPRPDRILIQYVPHAFGWKAINLPFAAWVACRAKRIAPVSVMFHEVAVAFNWRPAKHAILSITTRLMARLVSGSAERVFVSILGWVPLLRQLSPRSVPPEWLPVPCTVGTTADPSAIEAIRACYLTEPTNRLIGHFGTYGSSIARLLEPVAVQVLTEIPHARLLLIGRRSEDFRVRLTERNPNLRGRIFATGSLEPEALAANLRACDLLIQPCPDGVSSRRTSVMGGLANGVPVVTNLGHLSEPLWATARGIMVAATREPEAMAAAVRDVFALTPDGYREMSRAAAELYRSTFAVEHTISRLRAIR